MNIDLDELASQLEGSKCRAPFTTEWAGKQYHNALLCHVDEITEAGDVLVRVMFCNPIMLAMKPCNFFLDGNCRFEENGCKFSHGYQVQLTDLTEYEEPDFTLLKNGCRCLAKYAEDGLWYSASVLSAMEGNKFMIQYESHDSTDVLDAHNLLPLHSDDDDDSSSGDSGSEDNEGILCLNDDMQSSQYQTPRTMDKMGEWEQHTKGIGSKLLARMGFLIGQGLGKNGEGRATPVEVSKYPQGSSMSLDACMEYKERKMNGSDHLIKKQRRKKKQTEAKRKADYQRENKRDVFEFINDTLHPSIHKADASNLSDNSLQIRKCTKAQKKASNRDLNVEMFKISEDVKNAKRELLQLKEQLKRNQGRDKKVSLTIEQKILAAENRLHRLESSSQSIDRERNARKDHKKLTIF